MMFMVLVVMFMIITVVCIVTVMAVTMMVMVVVSMIVAVIVVVIPVIMVMMLATVRLCLRGTVVRPVPFVAVAMIMGWRTIALRRHHAGQTADLQFAVDAERPVADHPLALSETFPHLIVIANAWPKGDFPGAEAPVVRRVLHVHQSPLTGKQWGRSGDHQCRWLLRLNQSSRQHAGLESSLRVGYFHANLRGTPGVIDSGLNKDSLAFNALTGQGRQLHLNRLPWGKLLEIALVRLQLHPKLRQIDEGKKWVARVYVLTLGAVALSDHATQRSADAQLIAHLTALFNGGDVLDGKAQ